MNYNFVFILTYGRSGSTLLQGILNAIPGVLVRGENNAALRGLIESWEALGQAQKRFQNGSHQTTSPWFGIAAVDTDSFGREIVASFIRNVLCPPESACMIGFKEIRYGIEYNQLSREVDFMRRFFHKSAFIVNTRNLEETIASNIKARHDVTPEGIRASDAALTRFAANSTDVYHVHYNDYKDKPEALRPMFEFLGATFDTQAIRMVLEARHSG